MESCDLIDSGFDIVKQYLLTFRCVHYSNFILYLFGLGDILRKYNIGYHFYADDSQLYLSFSPNNRGDLDSAISTLQTCAADIRQWMTKTFLKLNEDKTEFVIFSSSRCRTSFPNTTTRQQLLSEWFMPLSQLNQISIMDYSTVSQTI